VSEPTPTPTSSSDSPVIPKGKSLKEFNYFDEATQPDPVAIASQAAAVPLAEERLKEYRRTSWKLSFQLGLSAAAVVAVTWFISGYRYWISYAFSSTTEPLKLGDVTSMRPEEIPHNAYVQVFGITEHRGLSQMEVRGFGFGRKEYWYFRLLGSRGVFIGVEGGDADKYGIVQEVTVSGRAVDPVRDHCCDKVLAAYREKFAPREEGQLRFILVDSRPGDGRFGFVLLFLLWAGVATSAGFMVRRAFLHATRKHLAGLPVGLPRR
jgi:hypothetical protein